MSNQTIDAMKQAQTALQWPQDEIECGEALLAISEAIAREEAQTGEPVAYEVFSIKFANGTQLVYERPENLPSYVSFRPLFTHPAPLPSGERPVNCGSSHCSCIECVVDDEQPPIGEREALIERHIYVAKHGVNPSMRDLARQTADMLAADAQNLAANAKWIATLEDRLNDQRVISANWKARATKSQQVEVPQGYTLVPIEVKNLFDFMDAAFVAVTSQQKQIEISLDLARKSILTKKQLPLSERWPRTDSELELSEGDTLAHIHPSGWAAVRIYARAVLAASSKPPKAERVPMTHGEKQRLWSSLGEKPTLQSRIQAYGCAIEEHHGISGVA